MALIILCHKTGPEKKVIHSRSLESKQLKLADIPTADSGYHKHNVPKYAVLPLWWQQSHVHAWCLPSQETICSQQQEPCLSCRRPSLRYLACPFSERNTMVIGPAALSYRSLEEGLTEVFVDTSWYLRDTATCTHSHIYRHTGGYLGKISLKYYLVMTYLFAAEVGSLSLAFGRQRTKATWVDKKVARPIIHVSIGSHRKALVQAVFSESHANLSLGMNSTGDTHQP